MHFEEFMSNAINGIDAIESEVDKKQVYETCRMRLRQMLSSLRRTLISVINADGIPFIDKNIKHWTHRRAKTRK